MMKRAMDHYKQLSEDHGVKNEQELQRLMALGLDREQLRKSGRLGIHRRM